MDSAADDVSLPKATVAKLVQELLPADFTCSKETKDLLTLCCKEFILAIASEANEICEKSSKKTMLPEHILAALKALGFEDFVAESESVFEDHKTLAKAERVKKSTKRSEATSGMTEEELADQQEKMFAASRARFDAGTVPDNNANAVASGSAAVKNEAADDDEDEDDE